MNGSTKKRMGGFTLVELMVTVVIGAFLTGTGLTLYVQSVKNRSQVQAQLSLQETTYLFHQTLRQYVNQGGFRALNEVNFDTPLLPVKDPKNAFPAVGVDWDEGRFVRLLPNGFAVRFEGSSDVNGVADGTIRNCAGEAIAEGELVELEFTVQDDNLFVCSSDGVDVSLISEGDNARVQQLVVELGIDNNADDVVDEYLTESDILEENDEILALKMSFLLVSNKIGQENAKDYIFRGMDFISTDKKVRQEFVTTIQLKH